MKVYQVQGVQGDPAGQGRRARPVLERERKRVRLETIRHARCISRPDRALLERRPQGKTRQAQAAAVREGQKGGY
jgi:hypothetical protein